MFDDCRETVSILYAAIFGAGDACVMISTTSILTAFAAFIGVVLVSQFIARRLWAKLTKPKKHHSEDFTDPVGDHPYNDDPNYSDSAIRSSKR